MAGFPSNYPFGSLGCGSRKLLQGDKGRPQRGITRQGSGNLRSPFNGAHPSTERIKFLRFGVCGGERGLQPDCLIANRKHISAIIPTNILYKTWRESISSSF